MLGPFEKCFHIHGTLSADAAFVWTQRRPCTIRAVQAVGSNANDATLKVGTTTDDDAYITAFAIGDSDVPVVKKTMAHFDGATADSQFPHVPADTVVKLTLDHDGAGGTAAADVTIVVECLEG